MKNVVDMAKPVTKLDMSIPDERIVSTKMKGHFNMAKTPATPTPAAVPAVAAAPNPAPVGDRAPVTQRGDELLSLIAGAEGGKLYLTQDEAFEAINAGYAKVDTADVQGNTAAVTLTDAGTAKLTSQGGSASGSKYAILSDIPIPAPTRTAPTRTRESEYPFDLLEVGQCFFVPAKDANDKPEERMSSAVTAARAKHAVEVPGQFTVKNKTVYAKDANGDYIKDAAGKRVAASVTPTNVPVTRLTRDFRLRAAAKDDPRGRGAYIWRVELTGDDAAYAAQPAATPPAAPAPQA